MRTTQDCKTMNKAYEILKKMTVSELKRFIDQCNVNYHKDIDAYSLMIYQAKETIRRKLH